MADSLKVLTDSSGRPMMLGDKVLLDTKCCEEPPKGKACAITFVADCQEDGTYGEPRLKGRACYSIEGDTQTEILNLESKLGLSTWKKNWKNQLEITFLKDLDGCDPCYDDDELVETLQKTLPPIPAGVDCSCDVSVVLTEFSPTRYGHSFPFWRLTATFTDEDSGISKTEDERYYYWEYKEFESRLAEWKSSATSIDSARLEWQTVYEIINLTNNYDGKLLSDSSRFDEDRVYEKLFTAEISGTVSLADGSSATYNDKLTIRKLYTYDKLPATTSKYLRHYAKVTAVERLDDSADYGVDPAYCVLIPESENKYTVLDVSGFSPQEENAAIRNLGSITITPIEKDEKTNSIKTYKVLDSGTPMNATGPLKLLKSDIEAGIEIKGTVIRLPSTKDGGSFDTLPVDKFDVPAEYTIESGEAALELATIMFGFQYEIGVVTNLDTAAIAWEQIERLQATPSATEIDYVLQFKCLVNIDKCFETKYLYTSMWRSPDCTTDSVPLAFPFHSSGASSPDTSSPGWTQVIDSGKSRVTKTDTLIHENEDTDFDSAGNLTDTPTLRKFNPGIDSHAYHVLKLSYLNFPDWCASGCPITSSYGEMVRQVVPQPWTSGADMCYMDVWYQHGGCILGETCDFWCWPGSYLCLNKEYPDAVIATTRVVNPLPTIDWSSGLLEREGGTEKYDIVYNKEIEIKKADNSITVGHYVYSYASNTMSLTEITSEIKENLTEQHRGKTLYLCAIMLGKTSCYLPLIDSGSSYETTIRETISHANNSEYSIHASQALFTSLSLTYAMPGCWSEDNDGDPTIRDIGGDTVRFGSHKTAAVYSNRSLCLVISDTDDIKVLSTMPLYSGPSKGNEEDLTEAYGTYKSTVHLIAFVGPSRLCEYVDGVPTAVTRTRYLPLPVIGETFDIQNLKEQGDIVPYSKRWKNIFVTMSGSHWFSCSKQLDMFRKRSSYNSTYNEQNSFSYRVSYDGVTATINGETNSISTQDTATGKATISTTIKKVEASSAATEMSNWAGTTSYEASGETGLNLFLNFDWHVGEDLIPVPVVYVDNNSWATNFRSLYFNAIGNEWKVTEATGDYTETTKQTPYASPNTFTPGHVQSEVVYGDPYSTQYFPWDGASSSSTTTNWLGSSAPINQYGGTLGAPVKIEGEWPTIRVYQDVEVNSTWSERKEGTDGSYSSASGNANQGWDISITITDMDAPSDAL